MAVYSNEEAEYKILDYIAKCREPVGAGNLADELYEDGKFSLSEATIGRYLRRLEQQGFLANAKYSYRSRGRIITEKGIKKRNELKKEKKREETFNDAMDILKNGGDRHLSDLLAARKIIEPEVAALAAKNASKENLASLRSILKDMDELTKEGKSMAGTDAPFHMEIAHASGNLILETVIRMLRSEMDYSSAIEYIVKSSSKNISIGHKSIYKAIEEHDADKARQIMDKHIQNIIDKFNAYEKKTCN